MANRGWEACTSWSAGTSTGASPAPESKCPPRPRSSAPRVEARMRGFSDCLHALKDRAEALGDIGQGFAYLPARMRPDLCLWGVPEGQGGGSPPLGLSIPRNLQNPEIEAEAPAGAGNDLPRPARPRNGLKGISKEAKKGIRDSLCLLEEVRPRLAFWTVTLPDRSYEKCAKEDLWPKFQTRVRDLLKRELQALGLPPLLIGVVEVGSERLSRTSKPMPHLHLAFYGWRCRGSNGQYLINKELMDGIVYKACLYAGLPTDDLRAASRIEPVRYSVKKYLTKYMTKAVDVDASKVEGEWLNCIPRQWWLRSSEMKEFVEGHFFHLPPAFVAFVLQQRKRLEAMQIGSGGSATVAWRNSMTLGKIAIDRDYFRFWSPGHLAWAMEWFAVWYSDPLIFAREADGWLAKHGESRENARQQLPPLLPTKVGLSSTWLTLIDGYSSM